MNARQGPPITLGPMGFATGSFRIPNSPVLIDLPLWMQGVWVEPSTSGSQLTPSNLILDRIRG